ncbi:hypothetical protein ACT80S_14365 [Ramlibacter sp. MAHUQ-53]|uniref:hypothetical protein n=1 Tax=unclassified Ramlibacter TaxID=2617605 RepID=UPI00363E3384
MAAALLLQWQVLPPGQAALAEAEAQARRDHAIRLARRPAAGHLPPQEASGPQDLQALLAAAPEPQAQLRTLAARAEAAQVQLARADYQRRAVPGVPLVQWQVSQPVRARYPQLREYIEAVLRALPTASLDQVSMRRESVGADELEARLRWSLWLPGPVAALVPRQVLLPAADAPAPRDLFAARSWAPPPTPLPVAAPAAPAAPPLPFAFLGKKLEDGRWEVFVLRDERTLVLREGEVVDGQWRVDRIAPPQLALTYLPLGQAQSLTIGDDR